jgi:hypothetical protein
LHNTDETQHSKRLIDVYTQWRHIRVILFRNRLEGRSNLRKPMRRAIPRIPSRATSPTNKGFLNEDSNSNRHSHPYIHSSSKGRDQSPGL